MATAMRMSSMRVAAPSAQQGYCHGRFAALSSTRRSCKAHFAARSPLSGRSRTTVRVAARRDDNVEEAKEEAKGILAKKHQQRPAYQILAVVWGAAALAGLFLTPQWMEYSLGSRAGAATTLLQRYVSALNLPMASIAWVLSKAADAGRLDHDVYQRLNLGLFTTGAILVAATCNLPKVLAPAYERALLATGAATAAVGGIVYAQTSGHGFSIGRIVDGLSGSLKSLTNWDNNKSMLYAGLSAAAGIYAVILLLAPASTIQSWVDPQSYTSAAGNMLQKQGGALLATASVAAFNLKEAADRGRLGSSTYKNLNLALSAAGGALLALSVHAFYFTHRLGLDRNSAIRIGIMGVAFLTTFTGYISTDEDDRASNSLSNLAGKGEDAFDEATDNVKGFLNKGERKADKYENKAERKGNEAKDEAGNVADKAEGTAKDIGRDVKRGAKDVKRDLEN